MKSISSSGRPCACGCGGFVTYRKSKYLSGHSSRRPDIRANLSLRLKSEWGSGYRKLRTAAATQKSVAAMHLKGEGHECSKPWKVRSPDNLVYMFKNVRHFVRNNPHLFDAEDVKWRKSGRAGPLVCRAALGLTSLSPRAKRAKLSWKGWRVIPNEDALQKVTPASSNSPNSPAASPASRPLV